MCIHVDLHKVKELRKKVQIARQLHPRDDYGSYITMVTTLLQDCINERDLLLGAELHGLIVHHGLESNTFVGSYLIRLFGTCGRLLEASLVFSVLCNPNVYAWNEIILAQTSHGEYNQAITLFIQMVHSGVQPDRHIYIAILKACASAGHLSHGREVHWHIMGSACESDLYVNNALINMYMKCAAMEDACAVFDKLIQRDVVSWSTIIAGYAQYLYCQEAVLLFNEMQREGTKPNNVAWNAIIYGYAQAEDCEEAFGLFKQMLESRSAPDNFTFVSILKACSTMAAVHLGRLIHADIVEAGYVSDVYIRSILIDMYAKGGYLDDMQAVFQGDRNQNTATWTAMMAAYSLQSNYKMVLQYFEGMRQEGWLPNDITFLCLLSACSHMGFVEDAYRYFDAMRQDYCIMPTYEHYNILLDLLGRAGRFEEIDELLKAMRNGPSIVGWTTLLNSCRVYGNVDLGRRCLHQFAKMEEVNASSYVLVTSLFSDAAMWDNVRNLLDQRQSLNAWKKPAVACIEVELRVHKFSMGDKAHSQVDAIYEKLGHLGHQARRVGYLPELELVLPLA